MGLPSAKRAQRPAGCLAVSKPIGRPGRSPTLDDAERWGCNPSGTLSANGNQRIRLSDEVPSMRPTSLETGGREHVPTAEVDAAVGEPGTAPRMKRTAQGIQGLGDAGAHAQSRRFQRHASRGDAEPCGTRGSRTCNAPKRAGSTIRWTADCPTDTKERAPRRARRGEQTTNRLRRDTASLLPCMCGTRRTRTSDVRIFGAGLFHLSYGPVRTLPKPPCAAVGGIPTVQRPLLKA